MATRARTPFIQARSVIFGAILLTGARSTKLCSSCVIGSSSVPAPWTATVVLPTDTAETSEVAVSAASTVMNRPRCILFTSDGYVAQYAERKRLRSIFPPLLWHDNALYVDVRQRDEDMLASSKTPRVWPPEKVAKSASVQVTYCGIVLRVPRD